MKYIGWRVAGVLFALAMASENLLSWQDPALSGSAFASPSDGTPPVFAAQTNREGGVTVTVVPRSLEPGATSWDFEVSLETHTQSLSQDLTVAALLIDSQGKSHAPVSWEGDPPGGHHRRGLLRFRPLPGNPPAVELRINGIGGVDSRVFRWQRKQ
jgi:hypothetical protein